MIPDSFVSVVNILLLIPVVLLSLSFHEFAHAFVSYRLGDPTAKYLGRLTMNPLKHLDVLGTIMIFASLIISGAGFGWAKPVPINPSHYRDRRRGTMLVSLAGPLSNVFLALVFSFPMFYIGKAYDLAGGYSTVTFIVYYLCIKFYEVNIGLAVFNILPVPPLDGSKILSGILPPKQYFKMMQYENYIGLAFLLIIFGMPGVLNRLLSPLVWIIETSIKSVVIPIINMLI